MSKKWRFMELGKIAHLRHAGRELLGKYIYWTEKRDGSCLAVWMEEETGIKANLKKFFKRELTKSLIVSSRNQKHAEKNIRKDFVICEDASKVIEYLKEYPNHIVFGELLRLGISPTRIENHEKVEFIVFDILTGDQFYNFQQVHQFCFHFGIKCVELFGEGRFTSMKSLLNYRDKMLNMCKVEPKREGVVLKTFYKNGRPLYAKEKLDTATSRGKPKLERGKPSLSPLPYSEAMGAIDKAYADIGEKFGDKKVAMPVVARYIHEEMKKHLCGAPECNYYDLYRQYCNDRKIQVTEKPKRVSEKTKKTVKTASLWNRIVKWIKKLG